MQSSIRPGRIEGIKIGLHFAWLFEIILLAWSPGRIA